MKSAVMVLGIVVAVFSSQSAAVEQPRVGNSCVSKSSSYVVYRGEENFESAARDFNAFFGAARASGKIAQPSQARLVDAKAEVIWIEADVMHCAATGQPDSETKSIGGCDYVGCTGSVPHEFQDLPPGSSVSMSSCGSGIQTTGTFQRQSNGTWMMTGYRTEQVTHCSPMG